VARPAPSDCIFCRIARGEAPSFRVYEDALSLAFMDIAPVSEGHVLVVTREHFTNLFEATPEALAAVAKSSLLVAGAIRAELAPAGLAVAQLNGEAAGQTVFHYHVHLIPRKPGDGYVMHGRVPGKPERLRELARALATRLGARTG
jgi:histidine triad (HIT) family protein